MFFDTILFDLDDTLHDRNNTLHCFIDLFMGKYESNMANMDFERIKKIFLEIDFKGYKPRKEMFIELLERVNWKDKPNIEDLLIFWDKEFPKCAIPMEGLYQVLNHFASKGIKMGIVTNGEALFQNIKLDKLNLKKYIGTIVISEEVGIRKPDYRIFDIALSRIGSKRERTLFVGDNPSTDIEGALKAGLIPVWLCGNETWAESSYKPTYIIKELTELISIK